jgi:biotin carboxylase
LYRYQALKGEDWFSTTAQGKEVITVLSFIVSFVQIAAQLSSEVSCNQCIDINAITNMKDKVLTRLTLEGLSLSPSYIVIDQTGYKVDQIIEDIACFPLIVKAPASTGSKEVFLVEDNLQLDNAVRSLTLKYTNQRILIEEYVNGPQYLLKVLVQNAICHLVADLK